MGNAWFVSPMGDDWTALDNPLRVPAEVSGLVGKLPSPSQVFNVVEAIPNYTANIRRQDRKSKGQAISIELRRPEGAYAIDIRLLKVTTDNEPVGVFVFDYYQSTAELVNLVAKLAEVCGPLVLWHDSGGESSILVMPDGQTLQGPKPDSEI